jgi:hypothetical protein
LTDQKPSTEDVLRRLTEVLDVLGKISEDLEDIARSLKTVRPVVRQTTTPPVQAPQVLKRDVEAKPHSVEMGIDDVRMMFTKELEELLEFKDMESYIRVKPLKYLGSDNFAKIASIIREAGGEYVSAGRESHFRIPKQS